MWDCNSISSLVVDHVQIKNSSPPKCDALGVINKKFYNLYSKNLYSKKKKSPIPYT